MTNIQSSLQNSYRKLSRLSYGANFLGALITFIFLSVIDPIPEGAVSVRLLEPVDILFFGIAVVVIFASATLLGNWLQRPFRNWQRQLESGAPPGDIPPKVASRILNWPLIASMLMAGIWLFSAFLFTYIYDNPSTFIGITIGGLVTTGIIYAGSDLLWRDVILQFFPSGNLSDVPAIRLWVQRRLLLGFIVIGAITPILLVILTVERSRELMAAANPEVVFNNLVIVLIFILSVGLATGVIVAVLVARAIVGPIQVLRRAMSQVENNELETSVPVTTNDELGFLGERFNQMTNGLRQGEKLRQLFGLYVSPEIARAAVQTGAGLGGELVECTVMFSDIRDFTSLTEQMPPARLVDLINHYMEAMVSVIVKHGGMITRFGGDSILAVFGSPLNAMENHADRAIAAGVDMRRSLAIFNQADPQDGRPRLENGIGIASGPVIAGNVGGKARLEYTVMGDAANLAARLEDLTKELSYPILISSETFHLLNEHRGIVAEPLEDISIKGKREKVTIYGLSD